MKIKTPVTVTRRNGITAHGVITAVRPGPRGDWYDVKLTDGTTHATRLANLKAR